MNAVTTAPHPAATQGGRLLTIDAEANGLAGQAFCVAMNVTQNGPDGVRELDSAVFRCPIVDGPVNEWVRANVLPALVDVDVNCVGHLDLITRVRDWHQQWQALGVPTMAHVVWPVEATLLSHMYPGADVWSGPFPLLDVATLLAARGHDPKSVDDYLRGRGIDLPDVPGSGKLRGQAAARLTPHHPLYDVRAAARTWWDLINTAAAGQPAAGGPGELSEHERKVLLLVGRRIRPGQMANEIRDLGYEHDAPFWAVVDGLLNTERALAFDPVLVRRLQRLRQLRTGGLRSVPTEATS